MWIVITKALYSQEKEQKQFKEALKQEFKLLKQEIDMLPKDIRKETLKRKREEKEIEQTEKVTDSSAFLIHLFTKRIL